jgi:hypothetical protein
MSNDNTGMVKVEEQETALAMYGEDGGAGFEDASPEDQSIPFEYLLQSNSPELRNNKNARAGMFWNSVDNKVTDPDDGGLVGVFCGRTRSFVEWRPDKGGIAGRHAPDSDYVKKAFAGKEKFGKLKLENGNELVETVYMTFMTENGPFCFIVKGTGHSPYKKFYSRLQKFCGSKIPMYAVKVRLKSAFESNPKGDFYVPTFEGAVSNDLKASLIAPDSELYKAAKAMTAMIQAGTAKLAEEQKETSDDESFV